MADLPVPPPPVRPSIAIDGGAVRPEDDHTYKRGDIIKAYLNARPCEQEGASPAHVITELQQLLQFHIATYMHNDIAGIPQEGRLRCNLTGKRVHFSARTVITPGDPNLELVEVCVPKNIAMNLTYPDRVTPYNIAYLQELVRNGPTVYPGARYTPQSTPPYNANFDGDEMHMHVPQSEETRTELSQIAWVPRQIITPQSNKPVMSIVQDMLCGIRKFTLRDTFLDWNQVQNILLWVPDWDGTVPIPAIIKPNPLQMGKQILSMVVPRGIDILRSPDPKSSHPVYEDGMMIENGEIIFGIIEKKTVGAPRLARRCCPRRVLRKGPGLGGLPEPLQMPSNGG